MKKNFYIEKIICDSCGAVENYSNPCLYCGIDHCYECKGTHGKEYTHGVNFSGYGDGYYCDECDKKLSESKEDSLHQAYRKIAALKKEANSFYRGFKIREEKAERELKNLLP